MKKKTLGILITLFLPTMLLAQEGIAKNEIAYKKTQLNHKILVVGHRGYPGIMPEETRPSYESAATNGADYLELDLHMTKDCQLIARHNPWMKDNTNVEQVAKTNPEVAKRIRTTPGRFVTIKWQREDKDHGPDKYLTDLVDPKDYKSRLKALVVDGEDHTNDWSVSDFTLKELKDWIGGTSFDAAADRPSSLNGKFPILTFQEVIDIAKEETKRTERTIGIYPESKNPIWNNGQAIANGCGALGSHPFEDSILKVIEKNGLNSKESPIIVQSFDPQSLKYLRSKGLKTKVIQLMDGNDVDYYTGKVIYNTNNYLTFVSGRPYSWSVAGKPDYFGSMLTPAGLNEVATYADIIGPWKMEIMTFLNTKKQGARNDINLVDLVRPNQVIADAHKLGLSVHPFTFRNEKQYLAGVYHNQPINEYLDFYEAGVDGVFTDYTGTAIDARSIFEGSIKLNSSMDSSGLNKL
ncbi:glycerophosphodiester phosphodiesterase family protein [Yokenella regensburgei]|uniref:glycerophosphodiester phosphodiesterase family protein n=1 Tax=Yokenella regensburgei TaxID=158877 RepID=UPI003ED931EB